MEVFIVLYTKKYIRLKIMKKCNNCNYENKYKAKYCVECGEKLFNESLTKKESKKKFYMVMAMILILVGSIFIFNQFMTIKNPTTKVLLGINNFANEEEKSFKLSGDMEVSDIMGSELIESLALEVLYNSKSDKKGAMLSLLFENEKLYNSSYEVKDDTLLLDLFEDKNNIYYIQDIEIQEALNAYNELGKYLKSFKLESDDKLKYLEILKEELGDDIYESEGKIVIDLKRDKMYEIAIDLFREAKSDNKLMESLYNEMTRVFKEMREDNFEYKDAFNNALYESFMEEFPKYDDFKDDFIEAFEDIIDQFEYALDSNYNYGINLKLSFDISFLNEINNIDIVMDLTESGSSIEEINLNLDLNEGYVFNNYSKDNAKNIKNMDLYSIEEEITNKLAMTIFKNISSSDKMMDKFKKSELYKSYTEYYNDSGVDDMLKQLFKELKYIM